MEDKKSSDLVAPMDAALDKKKINAELVAEFDSEYIYSTADIDAIDFEELRTYSRQRIRFEDVKSEYTALWAEMAIRRDKADVIKAFGDRIYSSRTRYRVVEQSTKVPWYIIGIIHSLEAGLRFDAHLHNGDPLTARTVQVPAGRPRTGQPPFTWEESAVDALTHDGFANQRDWTVERIAFRLEGFNGWGYRQNHPNVKSPYLWSFTNHYSRGKYIADGKWSETAVSKQCGAMAILRYMVDAGMVRLQFEPRISSVKEDVVEQYEEMEIEYYEEEEEVSSGYDVHASSANDVVYIPELIRQGSTSEGLSAARRESKRLYSEYPFNGCAAHLSVLLRQSNIRVKFETDAGDLVSAMKKRGWKRVEVGNQRPGDIGVTYDILRKNPGADHVYLVISVDGRDLMMIADNQWKHDAPHPRAASGRNVGQGKKTATEYFLRAT